MDILARTPGKMTNESHVSLEFFLLNKNWANRRLVEIEEPKVGLV